VAGGDDRQSNVKFLLPYQQVLGMWYRCVRETYDPDFLYERFCYNVEHTFKNRLELPVTSARLNLRNVYLALQILTRLVIRVGVLSDYRKTF